MSIVITPQPLSYPSRILPQGSRRPLYWLAAAILLFAFQILSGTLPLFAVLVFIFAILTYFAVRAAGGLESLMGISVFILAMQNVLVAQVVKVFLWQPAEKPLIWPIETLGIYCLAMAGIALAGVASRRLGFQRRKPWLIAEINPQRLKWLAIIGTVFSVVQLVGAGSVNSDTGQFSSGGLHGLFSNMKYLPPLAVAAGTAYYIVSSQGRRSFGLLNGIAILIPSAVATIVATRHSAIEAFIVYFATCWAFRFRFRPIHFAVLAAGWYFATYILFPYALYARDFVRTRDMAANVSKASALFLDLIANPDKYQEKLRTKTPRYKFLYYDGYRPTLERFAVLVIADAIVDGTLRGGTTEMDTLTPGFLMVAPRILLPDKPYDSTTLARREPGIVGRHDHTTGITTGFVCDAFSCFGWPGAFFLPFLVSFALFSLFSIVIDTSFRFSILSLSLAWQFTYGYSEQSLAILIVTALQGPIVFAATIVLINWLVSLALMTQRRFEGIRRRAMVRPNAASQTHLMEL